VLEDAIEKTRALVLERLGVYLAEHKSALIENRISRLKTKLGFDGSIEELIYTIEKGAFSEEFVSAFTTNQTSFFREPAQFEDFQNRFLPEAFGKKASITVLCAGCSSGEEAYSMGICFAEAKKAARATESLKITAVDIDGERLNIAKNGVYPHPLRNPFPLFVKEGLFFDTHEDSGTKKISFRPEIKELISFEKHNLSSKKENFKNSFFDAVFCRNTLIYFDKPTQEMILSKLLHSLKIGGTLYLGHSENPLSLITQLQKKGHNIYIKKPRDEI
jgi:chemotaxis protein methyltransferase CheR